LGRQIANPLGLIATKGSNDDVLAKPGGGQRASSPLARLSADGLQHDESTRHDPRRAQTHSNRRFDDAIEHPEELDLKRPLSRLLSVRVHRCHAPFMMS